MVMHQQTINILNTSNGGSGNKQNYYLFGPLYVVSMAGDWETAELIFDQHRDLVGLGLTKNLSTALHVAATAEETKLTINFVKNLVNMMTREDLERKNKHSNTAFWIASASGKTEMAKIMMKKNSRLPNIRGKDDYLPLSIGAKKGSYDIVKWLYKNSQMMSGCHWKDNDRDLTLLGCVENDVFDFALEILADRPELARNVSVLEVLARKPEAFKRYKSNSSSGIMVALKLLQIIWGHATSTMNIDEIYDLLRGPPTSMDDGTIQYSSRILFIAAERGNIEYIVELLRTYPDLMIDTNDDGLTIFHIAVMHRHHDIYNLLYEIGDFKNDICILNDKSGNNMLHLVGKTSMDGTTYMTSGASLLMQRELAWFNEVEQMMPPYLREVKNKAGQTPYELFSKENEYLVSKGLKLMKDTMIVATLIVTVAFAVAFTIPGGYNQEHGLPIFIHQRTFLVFVFADTISLMTSSFSLIMFLSLLASNVNQRALMHSLPRYLMTCLPLLATSVAAMMVTFSASFFVLYHNKLKRVPIFIALFATTPIVEFAILQFPLFVRMLNSTDEIEHLFQPKKRMLYSKKPRLPVD